MVKKLVLTVLIATVGFAQASHAQQRCSTPGEDIKADIFEQGMRARQSHNFADASRLFSQAADAGNTYAEGMLAQMYQNGWGVPQDINKAMRLYLAAAQAGSGAAMTALGTIYAVGVFGAPKDLEQARRWYTLAAATGCEAAKMELQKPEFQR